MLPAPRLDCVPDGAAPPTGLLGRLAQDSSGNTLAMIAAAVFPLLAMVGGGIDMGRTYLSKSRLQQACDSGVLAARKKLGSEVIVTGELPQPIAAVGQRFFDLNFGDGAYGTENRAFELALQTDTSITGTARVDVPTTIMNLFGYSVLAVSVECQARLNFSNTDVMFVLDTTGSMLETNPSDTKPRIDVLRDVVKSFHTELEASKTSSTRIRYGFLPYSTNVNVGGLLKSDWVVDSWTYQSRRPKALPDATYSLYSAIYEKQSGSGPSPIAPFNSATCPASTYDIKYSLTTLVSLLPHKYYYYTTENGTSYSCAASDGSFMVTGYTYANLVTKQTWTYAYDKTVKQYTHNYRPVTYDVSVVKGPSGDDLVHAAPIEAGTEMPNWDGFATPYQVWPNGCIEERDTYEIDDYDDVDLSRALDLDIDLIPVAGQPATQWRPQFPDLVWARAMWWDGTGAFSPAPVDQPFNFLNPSWAGYAACPTQARKLAELGSADVAAYVDGLAVGGSTYHDIGMIWGGRLLSGSGIFATENQDVSGKPTARHMIFLTDGETQALDVSYGTYGVEPLDRRRWDPASPKLGLTLTDVVERRFGVACKEVKKKNITVWVVGFGTSLNPIMTECAGPGHFFEANNAGELGEVFSKIAQSLGDLRISK